MTILHLIPVLSVVAICCGQISAVSGELFVFGDNEGSKFAMELTDPKLIRQACDVLAGKETGAVHVMGTINKTTAKYNPDFSFHLVPETIRLFEAAIEVCDATINFVEDHLDEACGAFLPGCVWCPWSSKLIEKKQ